MKKILIICLITLVAYSAFAEGEESGHYVQMTKIYETLISVGNDAVGVDELDMDLIQQEIGWMQSVDWNVLSITPVVVSLPTGDGKFTPVTRYIIVVYERWVE